MKIVKYMRTRKKYPPVTSNRPRFLKYWLDVHNDAWTLNTPLSQDNYPE